MYTRVVYRNLYWNINGEHRNTRSLRQHKENRVVGHEKEGKDQGTKAYISSQGDCRRCALVCTWSGAQQ